MEILLVDDNVDISTMFSKYFTLKGHKCSVSNSGQNALQMIENQKYDIILLDLAMPDFSGRDMVDYLYKVGKMSNKLIVSLTASSVSEEDTQELKRKGVHSVLKKPIDPDDLLNYLEKVKSQRA